MTNLRKLLFLVPLMLFASRLLGQEVVVPLGQWKAYVSHNYVVDIASDGSHLYVITQGGFFTYEIATGEVQSYSTIEGLSNISPTTILHDDVSGQVFIGFNNGMINYFSTPGDFRYITDIHRTEQFTNKAIRSFEVHDGLLYVATDFGIVVYDIAKRETRYSVTKVADNLSGSAVRDITITNGLLFASMESKGLFVASLSHPNITQPTAWSEVTGTQGLPDGNCKFVTHTGELLYSEVDGILWRKRLADTLWSTFGMPTSVTWASVEGHGDVFTASYSWNLEVIYPDSTRDSYINWGILGCSYVQPDRTMWIGDQINGLQRRDPFGNFTKGLSPEGPNTNYVTDVVAGNGEVYWAPRGKKGPSDRWYDRSGINYFSFRDEGMKVLSQDNNELDPNRVALDFGRAFYEVSTGRTFMGSWGDGIVELMHGDTVRCIVKKKDPISVLPADSSSRVSGLALDNYGNLWITLVIADYRLNVLDAEGNWHYWPYTSAYPVGIMIDDYGTKWINNQGQGILVMNENGTLSEKSDDQSRTITSDAGNGGLPNNSVLSIEKDLDGAVWVGTSEGAVVFYDPGSIFSSSAPDASCPLVEGYCLLRDQKVNAIAVDGANRKWFGTDNGVYLMSADGTQELYHYTIDNSPLLDNGVKEICIDQSTGEIFFGTDKGLISLQGEATEGRDTCEILCFPNPITVDHVGSITIRGLGAETKVKITDAAGMLVKEIEALGGTAVWDANDMRGIRVRPGIYLVLSADDDRQSACIGKIAVLERQDN